MTLPRPTSWLAIAAAAFAIALVAAPRAQAFTLQESGTNPDGSAKFYDPADKLVSQGSNNGTSGGVTRQFGNSSVYFGPATGSAGNTRSDQDFKNRMFDPLGKPGQ